MRKRDALIEIGLSGSDDDSLIPTVQPDPGLNLNFEQGALERKWPISDDCMSRPGELFCASDHEQGAFVRKWPISDNCLVVVC